jgi:hypothetical protein
MFVVNIIVVVVTYAAAVVKIIRERERENKRLDSVPRTPG